MVGPANTTRSRTNTFQTKYGIKTPQDFASAVSDHATLRASHSLSPGDNYVNLSKWLQGTSDTDGGRRIPKPLDTSQDDDDSRPFLSLYTIHQDGIKKASDFKIATEFSNKEIHQSNGDDKSGFMAFLMGYPSPEWLTAVGFKLHLDPEFFQRHLDFKASVGRPDYHTNPSLPSSMTNTIRLVLPTIGSREVSTFPGDNNMLERMKASGIKKMDEYLKDLRRDNRVKQGDSIVRRFHILDETHFVVEQEISLCVERQGQSWVGVVWSDVARELGQGLPGPWHDIGSRGTFYPTIQHWHGMALGSKPQSINRVSSKYDQSAMNLTHAYGQRTIPEVAVVDSFYAFQEVFLLVTFAENQFLNLLERKIASETNRTLLESRTTTLSNLAYFKSILENHIQTLKSNIVSVRNGGGLAWLNPSSAENELSAEAQRARASLLQDFTYLNEFAERLGMRCDRGMDLVLNAAMLMESKETYIQAKGVARLTRLAFFYIPLSFTTGFFGMNFRQLGNGTLSLWIWFLVAFLVTLVSMIISAKPLKELRVKLDRRASRKQKREIIDGQIV